MIRVTGASGFIGNAVLEYCKAKALPVTGYTRSNVSSNSLLEFVSSYHEVPGDGYLIHLGEHNSIATITSDIVKQQLEVSKSLSQKPFKKVVYVSSAAVYRASENCISVHSKNFSDSMYAEGKLKSEKFFTDSGNSVARLSNVYGPMMSQNNVLTTVLRQRNKSVIEVQNTKPVRDYVWVEDVAKALVEIVQSPQVGTFHVSTGVGTSVEELISVSCQISKNIGYQVKETQPGNGNKIILDCSETTKEIGWRPETSLYSGISKLIGSL